MSDILATAIVSYLTKLLKSSAGTRAFFRLDGFDDATYRTLLQYFSEREDKLAERELIVRTTAEINGFENYHLGYDTSSTRFRNELPKNKVLLLIFNEQTSDWQGTKDIFAITESQLAAEGLDDVINAALTDYQLSPQQRSTIKEFIARFSRHVYKPQLWYIVEFLTGLNTYLKQDQGAPINKAIAECLPFLGIFRSSDFTQIINSPKGDKLLQNLHKGARLGAEIIEESQINKYLDRLKVATFQDDLHPTGLSAVRKKELIEQFLTDVITERDRMLKVLSIDWSEVSSILFTKKMSDPSSKWVELYNTLKIHLERQGFDIDKLSPETLTVLDDLQKGRQPNPDALHALLTEIGEQLPKNLRTQLSRLRGVPVHQTADFIGGIAHVAIQLLYPLKEEISDETRLEIVFKERELGTLDVKKSEALSAFNFLYGGIERVSKGKINWRIDKLKDLAQQDVPIDDSDSENSDQEKDFKVELLFDISVKSGDKVEQKAKLKWIYRSDSSIAASYANIVEEGKQISDSGYSLRIPVYNCCQANQEIKDLDLSRPIASLGRWFHRCCDLRALLAAEPTLTGDAQKWSEINKAFDRLEQAWGKFVRDAETGGFFNSDLSGLLKSYEGLLFTFGEKLTASMEAYRAARLLSQAWIVGPEKFEEWAMVPFIHPLKLHWFNERCRHFFKFIERLLDPTDDAAIVSETRFRKELSSYYNSANFPAVLVLPDGQNNPRLLSPVVEIEGYELYKTGDGGGLSFAWSPSALADDDRDLAIEVAVKDLGKVVKNYLAAYPYVKDGLDVYLVNCRDGAFPGLFVKHLNQLITKMDSAVKLNVIVHSVSGGAPIFQRVTSWLKENEEFVERPKDSYFPDITLKVLECGYNALLKQADDTDLVILYDVLSEKGQKIEATEDADETVPLEGYLPFMRGQQEPFRQGDLNRYLQLSPKQKPALIKYFYNLIGAFFQQKAVSPDKSLNFRLFTSLQLWDSDLRKFHQRFNWVVCYDVTVDRFLLEQTTNDANVISYSLGLGAKHRHNLTVSSSLKARSLVERRLLKSLGLMFGNVPQHVLQSFAESLVKEANKVSGSIVLRAAGPGAFLNELIGMVLAKRETEELYLEKHPDALFAWIYLDDFSHWFDNKLPDLLFVAVSRTEEGKIVLHVEVVETKCIGSSGLSAETIDAQRQVAAGINKLAKAWAPGNRHLDADYWYDQLYRAFVGNLSIKDNQFPLWGKIRNSVYNGQYELDLSGHAWIFCHDSNDVGDGKPIVDEKADILAPDAEHVEHWYHCHGQVSTRKMLMRLARFGQPQNTSVVSAEAPSNSISAPSDQVMVEGDPNGIVRVGTSREVEARDTVSPFSIGLNGEEIIEIPEADHREEPGTTNSGGESIDILEIDPIGKSSVEPPFGATGTAAPDSLVTAWIREQATKLAQVLRSYNINTYPIQTDNVDLGPSVARFKIRLYPGEILANVQRRSEDIQRGLALGSKPLIDNISGTSFVGIDIVRPDPEPVQLLNALSGLEPGKIGELNILLGKTSSGIVERQNLAKLPHLLIAGTTGSGKTIFLYSLILCLVHQYGPQGLGLILIDPKQTDFVYFEDLPHLLNGNIITEPEEAIKTLEWLTTNELNNRTERLRSSRHRDLLSFNAANSHNPMRPIVVFIDEYADLVQVLDKNQRQEFERNLGRLAQRARSVGIHLVVATQRPSADIVTSSLKANLPARIAFRLPSHNDSMTVLDQAGAENLIGKGDMLALIDGKVERLQGFYISERELDDYLNSKYSVVG